MIPIKVKWGKEVYSLDVDPNSKVIAFKKQLEQLMQVPAEKQKIMGMKVGVLNNDATLAEVGVAAGKTFMLIGAAGRVSIPVAQAVACTVDSGGHAATTATSNGLKNFANTCYMNAALQMLRSVPEIKQDVVRNYGRNMLLRRLGELFLHLDETKDSVVPRVMWVGLTAYHPAFFERDENGMFRQQDAQEALSIILQHVTEALPDAHKQLFHGTLHQTLTCTEDAEDKGTETEVPFMMLTCNIAGEVQTLEAGLEQAFNEHFTATSERLQRDASFTRLSRIAALPEYVFVHMVRFSWKSDVKKKAKILKPISFPFTLDLSMFVTESLKAALQPARAEVLRRRDQEWERRRAPRGATTAAEVAPEPEEHVPAVLHNESGFYELCGVISHKGRSADNGHYVYWGKKVDTWLVFDDENVAAVSEEDVRRLRGVGEAHIAYVLLYRSRDPLTHRPVIPM